MQITTQAMLAAVEVILVADTPDAEAGYPRLDTLDT